MTPDEVATYLAGAGLGLTLGVDLFDVPYPVLAQDRAVAIDIYNSLPADRTFGPSLTQPLGEHPEFNVFVRDARGNDAAAKTLAYAVFRKLDFLGPVTLSGVLYRDIRAIGGEPKFLAFDDNQRPVYSMTFLCDKNPS